MRPTQEAQNPEERRRFERVDIAHQSQVLVLDAKGRQTGILRQLARGGFMMEPDRHYTEDSKIYSFTINFTVLGVMPVRLHHEAAARQLAQYASLTALGVQHQHLRLMRDIDSLKPAAF